MKKKIAINGFGRIGKAFLRAVLADPQAREKLELVCINRGPAAIEHLPLFFTYDSVLSRYNGTVKVNGDKLLIFGGKRERSFTFHDQEAHDHEEEMIYESKLLTETTPQACNWEDFELDWIVDCSGTIKKAEDLTCYRELSHTKLLISAPCMVADQTVVLGVNEQSLDHQSKIISLASCTTNCFAQLIHVLDQHVGITQGLMTTVHAYTNTQSLVDSPTHDPRRGRAAALNIVPSTTGADAVIGYLFPHLAKTIGALSLRVPVPTGSLVDFTFMARTDCTEESLNALFKQAAQHNPYLSYTELPLVSSDYIEHPASAIFDATLTLSRGPLHKVSAWYDNEYGYASRMKDFLLLA